MHTSWMAAAVGTASNAPTTPSSAPPTRMATIVAAGETSTARRMTGHEHEVLELLVHDEEGDGRDPRAGRDGERHGARHDSADGGPDERHHVHERDEQAERDRIRHVELRQDELSGDAGDGRGRKVAEDVHADAVEDLVGQQGDPRTTGARHEHVRGPLQAA